MAKFYRRNNEAIQVLSEALVMRITCPLLSEPLPLMYRECYPPGNFPAGWEECSEADYKGYEAMFFKRAAQLRASFNQQQQDEYDKSRIEASNKKEVWNNGKVLKGRRGISEEPAMEDE